MFYGIDPKSPLLATLVALTASEVDRSEQNKDGWNESNCQIFSSQNGFDDAARVTRLSDVAWSICGTIDGKCLVWLQQYHKMKSVKLASCLISVV